MAAQRVRAHSVRRGQARSRGARRLGQADGDAAPAARRAARTPPGRHRSGSAPAARARSAPTATTPKASASGRKAAAARSAVKVWDERTFRNLDGDVELNTRNIKIALRRLRRFAREGVPDELDLDGTIDGTARNAGWLDLQMRPERRNRVKVLLFLDVGGSMDPHVAGLRGAVFGGEERVPAPRVFLLPQLRLRPRLARQRAAAATSASRRSSCCARTAPTGG